MVRDRIREHLLPIRPELVRGRPDPGWLFLTKSGRKMEGSSILETVRKAAVLAVVQKKVTPLALRRACATEMIRRNTNPWHVKELLGHEDFRSLDVYAKLTILDLKAAHREFHPREQGGIDARNPGDPELLTCGVFGGISGGAHGRRESDLLPAAQGQ